MFVAMGGRRIGIARVIVEGLRYVGYVNTVGHGSSRVRTIGEGLGARGML